MIGYARSRQALTTLAGLVVAMVVAIAVHGAGLRLYFDPERTVVRLGLLAPVLAVIAVHQSLGLPLGEAEAAFARAMRRLRACHLGVVLVVLTLGAMAYATIHGADDPFEQVVRNTALLVGLLLAGAVVVGPEAAWLLPVGLVLATYGFGVDYDEGRARAWAVLLHDVTRSSVAPGLGVLLIGGLLFVTKGPRRGRGDVEGE